MDSLITAAARALAAGDPIGALKRVALRDDAPALALRGIAMAQLGDLRAREGAAEERGTRVRSARGRGTRAVRGGRGGDRARVARPGLVAKALDAARATLEQHGDRVNAAHARYLEVRRLLLIGRVDEAEAALATIELAPLPPASRTAHELVRRRDRGATHPDDGGARGTHAGATRGARRGDPRADGGSRARAHRARRRRRRG